MKAAFKNLGGLLLLLLGIGAILRAFFVEVVVVGHDGMAPTMFAGEEVLVWKTDNLQMGDIGLCRHPIDASFVFGRVVGKTGMTVKSDRGALDVEGTRVEVNVDGTIQYAHARGKIPMTYGKEKLGNTYYSYMVRKNVPFIMKPTKVASGFFLLNDNRSATEPDSRVYGDVDSFQCVGEVVMRLSTGDSNDYGLEHQALDIIH